MLQMRGNELMLGDKIIGRFKDGVFTKQVKKARHFMNILNGYGIDSEAFNHIILPECHTIVLHETDTKRKYKVSVDTFNDKSIYKHFKPHRSQRFLEMRWWEEL